jgi:hypothetical protein
MNIETKHSPLPWEAEAPSLVVLDAYGNVVADCEVETFECERMGAAPTYSHGPPRALAPLLLQSSNNFSTSLSRKRIQTSPTGTCTDSFTDSDTGRCGGRVTEFAFWAPVCTPRYAGEGELVFAFHRSSEPASQARAVASTGNSSAILGRRATAITRHHVRRSGRESWELGTSNIRHPKSKTEHGSLNAEP